MPQDWLRKKATQQPQQPAQTAKPSIFASEKEQRVIKPVSTQPTETQVSEQQTREARRKFELENVQLDTKEWINKEEFGKLSTEEQDVLKTKGISGYNSYIENKYVKLNTNEYIPREDFNKLSSSDQSAIMSKGIAGYNTYKQQQAQAQAAAQAAAAQRAYEANTILLDTGERVGREDFNKLSNDDQVILKSKGVSGYNDYQQQQYQKQIEELSKDYTPLNSGEYVEKDYYDKLPADWQQKINQMGTQGWKDWWNANPYGGAKEFVEGTVFGQKQVYGKTSDPLIGIDEAGNRVYLGEMWPGSVLQYTGKPGAVTTADITARGDVLVPATVSLPSLLREQEAIQKGISIQANLSAASPEEIRNIQQKIQSGEMVETKAGEYVEKKELEKLTPEYQRVLVEEGSVALDEQIQKDTKQNYVTTSKGELITKEDYANLEPKYQKILTEQGISGLEATYATEDAQVKAAEQENVKQIADVKKQIANIEDAQKARKSEPVITKITNFLNKKATGEDLFKEIMTGGASVTKSFDDEQTTLDYLKAKQSALESNQSIPITENEYKQQILDKQTTAAELGIELLPFEYARPERWKTLDTWQKIVYPVLDIVTLIPVAGLAAKGAAAAVKGVSTAAKIAALGGKEAVQFAAKDAAEQLAKATIKTQAQRALLDQVTKEAARATEKGTAKIMQNAVKAAAKDISVAEKELAQITKNSAELSKLAKSAEVVKSSKLLPVLQRVEQTTVRTAKTTEVPANLATSGVVSQSTVENWNELTPGQRAIGITLAALPLGIPGKAINLLENAVDPYKIPLKALQPRKVSAKLKPGEMFAEKGGGGTVRLVINEGIGSPEQARKAMAELMKQLVEGENIAKAAYGAKEVKLKGTGLQATVGKTTISATPMGEIFKEGTGAFGARTNLEKYLADIKTTTGKNIEIKTSPIKIGTDEITVVAKPIEGVTITGKEGGLYTAHGIYNKFSHRTAFGGTGKIDAGLLISIPEISALPKKISKMSMKNMEKAAIETFDGSRHLNKIVEGFKQYNIFMEAENVILNGSQSTRTQNLRSRLADKLKLNKGEYYTRDPKGKIELFQMYLEGGRTTPYTLKELYTLKGKALKNSLEDMFFGLTDTIDRIKSKKPSIKENLITKEEQISKSFSQIDDMEVRNIITKEEAKRLKSNVYSEFKERSSPTIPRTELRKQIELVANRRERETEPREYGLDAIDRIEPVSRDRVTEEIIRAYRESPEYQRTTDRRTEYQRSLDLNRRENEIARGRQYKESAERQRTTGPTREQPREISREAVRPETREAMREGTREPRAEVRGEVREIPRERVGTTPRVMPRELPREVSRVSPRVYPKAIFGERVRGFPIMPTPAKFEDLTRQQKLASVAWRQGAFFHLVYPPYETNNVLHNDRPFPGVKTYKGPRSAYKSLSQIKGIKLPEKILWDLGIMDITFERDKKTKKVIMKYVPDVKQKTTARKAIGMPVPKTKEASNTPAQTIGRIR